MIPKSVKRWQDRALGNLGRDDDFERNVIPFWAVWTENASWMPLQAQRRR